MKLHSFPYPQNVDEGTNEFMYITILLPLFTMMSFIFFIPVVTRRVVQEKSSGVKVFINISGFQTTSYKFCHCSRMSLVLKPIVVK